MLTAAAHPGGRVRNLVREIQTFGTATLSPLAPRDMLRPVVA